MLSLCPLWSRRLRRRGDHSIRFPTVSLVCQSCGLSEEQKGWNVNHWGCVTWRKQVRRTAVVPDRMRVGIRSDIGCTGCEVGFLEKVSARVRGTLLKHCMSHTASVCVGYIVVKKLWDTQSSSSADKHSPCSTKKGRRKSRGHSLLLVKTMRCTVSRFQHKALVRYVGHWEVRSLYHVCNTTDSDQLRGSPGRRPSIT